MTARCQASRPSASIAGYCLLVMLVLVGLAAMHSGASAVTGAGSHSAPHSSLMAMEAPTAAAHEPGVSLSRAMEPVTATLAEVGGVQTSMAHGLMAGCVLALTGAIGLVLARVLARAAGNSPLGAPSTRRGQRTFRVPGLPAPPPRPRFSLCVLRT